jgi:ubiquinone/menaquinone biosynthesis C-methylase UbiE
MNATSYFDQSATTWDADPNRIELAKAVGEAILREARPITEMDVLDYGCGTGLIGLFLLPYVRSVTGADSSDGMLDVLRKKIKNGGISNMKCNRLDLEHDPVPEDRYHLIVTSMVLHHAADTTRVLAAFHRMLHPKGYLCVADLDKEPGLFHTPEAVAAVHHGFDRGEFKARLVETGFESVKDRTVHSIRKPVQGGGERDFPAFLMTALS